MKGSLGSMESEQGPKVDIAEVVGVDDQDLVGTSARSALADTVPAEPRSAGSYDSTRRSRPRN